MREKRLLALASSGKTTPLQSLSSAGGHFGQLATVNTCDYTNHQSVISSGDNDGDNDGGVHCTYWEWLLVLERPHQLTKAGLQCTVVVTHRHILPMEDWVPLAEM